MGGGVGVRGGVPSEVKRWSKRIINDNMKAGVACFAVELMQHLQILEITSVLLNKCNKAAVIIRHYVFICPFAHVKCNNRHDGEFYSG